MALKLFSANQTSLRAKAQLGMRLEVAVHKDASGNFRFISDETIQTTIMGFSKIPTTIIGIYNTDPDGNRDVMIGWKLSEAHPVNAEHPMVYNNPHDTIVGYKSFERAKIWSPDIYVVSIVSEVSVQKVKAKRIPDGEKCNYCNDFVYMAESNLPGGKYVCRPCKQSPYSKYNLSLS